MPKPTKGPRLGSSPTHERMILGQLCQQLFEHGAITTTETKAKRVRPHAEKLITKAKRGDLHARRLAARIIKDKGVLARLFDEIAPMMEGREGGYTRITKIGNRQGDNAPMAVIELVTEKVAPKAKKADKPAEEPKLEEPKAEEVVESDEPKADEAAETKADEPKAEQE